MLYVPFLADFFFLQNRNKGTINVLQGGRGSVEYGQRPYFYIFIFLDPSLTQNEFWPNTKLDTFINPFLAGVS